MNQNRPDVPIQPVEQPILCSPYEKPNAHWIYDTLTGEAVRQQGPTRRGLLVQSPTHWQRAAPNVSRRGVGRPPVSQCTTRRCRTVAELKIRKSYICNQGTTTALDT